MTADDGAFRLGVLEKAMPDGLSPEEKLLEAKNAGFDFVELNMDADESKIAMLDWPEEKIASLLRFGEQAEIRYESVCFSVQRKFPLGTEDRHSALEADLLLKKMIRFAVKTGIRIIQLEGYDCYYDEISNAGTKERFFRNLRAAAGFASMYGVVLGLETMDSDVMDTVEKIMYYVGEIRSPYLQIYPDVGNMANATDDICKDIRSGRGHIVSVHLKETTPGENLALPYGTGDVDFACAIAALLEVGVHRFTAEFWDKGTGDWRQSLVRSHEFLLHQFEAASEIRRETGRN